MKEDEINNWISENLDKYQYTDVKTVNLNNDQCLVFLKQEEKILSIYIDTAGNSSVAIEITPSCQLVDFQALAINGKIDDMLRLDPKGQYMFLFAGRNDLPRVSQHFTSDGYYLVIRYDHDGKICEIKYYSVFP